MIEIVRKISLIIKRILIRLSIEFNRVNNYTSEDSEYWANVKDKFKGQRGFVIGNGPSLKAEDLTCLKDEITIASNKIYLIFPKTVWRPQIYTVADRILWPKIKDVLDGYFDIIHIPDYIDSRGVKNYRYWKSPFSIGGKKFSPDLSKGAYGGHTVTYENIQIAMHLGLNPIYLIGCDHNYPGEKKGTPGIPIKQGGEQTHFIKNYRKKGEVVLPASISKMEESYRCARKAAEENNVLLLNATRGGRLEIFDRVDFDELLND